MTDTDTTTLVHPDAKGTLTVLTRDIGVYLSQGWAEKPTKTTRDA